jgi:hypothetical protein
VNLKKKATQVIFRHFYDYSIEHSHHMLPAISVPGDAGDPSSIKQVFAKIRETFGGDPEVLLFNVGNSTYGR